MLLLLGPALAILPLIFLEDDTQSGTRLALGLLAGMGLLLGGIAIIKRWKPWLILIRWWVKKLQEGSTDAEGEKCKEIDGEGASWDWFWFRVRSGLSRPLGLLAPPMDSSGRNAVTWPLIAIAVSALAALWLPDLKLHHDFFVAIAQVIPVLMVAIFVEATALFRVYMPVILRVFENRSGAPTPPQFFAFRRYMKNMLWLAVIGEIAAVVALAAGTNSVLLGILSGLSALIVGLALSSTFFERLQLDQFLRTRTPGGWNEIGEADQPRGEE